MSTSVQAKANGDITTPLANPSETQVRNMGGVAAGAEAKLLHPPGKICVVGFLIHEDHELDGIAARVYNSTDDGGEPPDGQGFPDGGAGVTYGVIGAPIKVEGNKVRYDFRFRREADGADNEVARPRANPSPGNFDGNWLIVWARWKDGAGVKCDWEFAFKVQVCGVSSASTECDS